MKRIEFKNGKEFFHFWGGRYIPRRKEPLIHEGKGFDMKFKAIPEKTGKVFIFESENYTEARNWVINHCDLSNNYTVIKI